MRKAVAARITTALKHPGKSAGNEDRGTVRAVYTTSTRRHILDLLKSEKRYLTANVIFKLLKADHPKIALSTIYRTLDLLLEMGAVSGRAEGAGETSFVYCTEEHHHHAICTTCGHVDEVDCGAMDQFRAALLAQQAFRMDDHSVEFYGRCARCQ
jgi:Fur family ferric uptake transcriptional regulator